MAFSLKTMMLFALVALVGTVVALPVAESDGPAAVFIGVDESELTTALMGAEMEDGEVLVCSLVSEKSGSWDCVWERQITLDLEDMQGLKKTCQQVCRIQNKQLFCGMSCSF